MTSASGRSSIEERHQVVEVDGRPIRYRTVGHGRPIVLVHGLAGSSLWWRRNIRVLAERYHVHLVDLPGFGAMRRAGRGGGPGDLAAWLTAWLAAAGLRRVHLIGHSLGGAIALRLAADRPESIDRLVLVAPAGLPTGRSLPGYVWPLARATRAMAPSFLPLLSFDTVRAGPLTLWRTAREILNEDARAHLDRVQSATLIVWGDRDPLVEPAHGPLLQAAIPGARLVVLPGAGHVPMFDRAAEFNAAVRAFLDEADHARPEAAAENWETDCPPPGIG